LVNPFVEDGECWCLKYNFLFTPALIKKNMSYIKWLREKIGTQKTILVFTTVILRDEGGRILLQRRADVDRWGLPGGVLEPGENILSCAQRELEEETGLTAGELSLVGVYTDPRYDSVYPSGDQVQQ